MTLERKSHGELIPGSTNFTKYTGCSRTECNFEILSVFGLFLVWLIVI